MAERCAAGKKEEQCEEGHRANGIARLTTSPETNAAVFALGILDRALLRLHRSHIVCPLRLLLYPFLCRLPTLDHLGNANATPFYSVCTANMERFTEGGTSSASRDTMNKPARPVFFRGVQLVKSFHGTKNASLRKKMSYLHAS